LRLEAKHARFLAQQKNNYHYNRRARYTPRRKKRNYRFNNTQSTANLLRSTRFSNNYKPRVASSSKFNAQQRVKVFKKRKRIVSITSTPRVPTLLHKNSASFILKQRAPSLSRRISSFRRRSKFLFGYLSLP